MQAQRSRLGPPPSWTTILKATLGGSLIGAFAAIGAAASTPDPNSAVVMPGAVIAVAMLFRRRIRAWAIVVSAILAAILSGPLWLAFNAAHAGRWFLVADAGLCPVAAVAVARLLSLMSPAIMAASQSADQFDGTEPARQPGAAPPPPASDPAAPPLPADLLQPPQ